MLLYGADADVSRWASYQLFGNDRRFVNSPSIGVIKDNKLICAVVYDNFELDCNDNPLSIEMSIASVDKRWCTRKNLNGFFAYPFIQLGVKRVLTKCSAEKPSIIKFNERLGFIKEGYHRGAWHFGGDCISFGMLREECRYI